MNMTNKRRKPNDKIFDNNYNKGELEYEQFRPVEIDKSYSVARMDEYNNSFDYHQSVRLQRKFHVLFRKSEWYSVFKKTKQIPKFEIMEAYSYFYKKLKNLTTSDCDIFIVFSDYLSLNYKVFYELLPYQYKANILKELDDKYNIGEIQKVGRLF